MTKERALALQRELRDRSSQVTFQAALRSCEKTRLHVDLQSGNKSRNRRKCTQGTAAGDPPTLYGCSG